VRFQPTIAVIAVELVLTLTIDTDEEVADEFGAELERLTT